MARRVSLRMAFRDARSLKYLPIVIPFALATVVGGIDCTESAAAVGDESTRARSSPSKLSRRSSPASAAA